MIRYAALLRGTESAWQAVSYGLTSLPLFAEVGAVYLNFGFWGLGLWPAWLVLKHFGTRKAADGDAQVEENTGIPSSETQSESGVKTVQGGQETKEVTNI